MNPVLAETIYIDFITSSATGAAADADSTPSYEVFEGDTDTALTITGGAIAKRTSKTGNYRITLPLAASDGFEVGKSYNVVVSATIGGVAGKAVVETFQVRGSISTLTASDVWGYIVDGSPASSYLTALLADTSNIDLIVGVLEAVQKYGTDLMPASNLCGDRTVTVTTSRALVGVEAVTLYSMPLDSVTASVTLGVVNSSGWTQDAGWTDRFSTAHPMYFLADSSLASDVTVIFECDTTFDDANFGQTSITFTLPAGGFYGAVGKSGYLRGGYRSDEVEKPLTALDPAYGQVDVDSSGAVAIQGGITAAEIDTLLSANHGSGAWDGSSGAVVQVINVDEVKTVRHNVGGQVLGDKPKGKGFFGMK